MSSLLILPTYNEKANLGSLIPKILSIAPVDILVIDDNSPDGTGEMAEELSGKNPGVYVLRRAGKLGLGSAYVAGFKWALEKSYDSILQMDSDFSHDPQDLPRLLSALKIFDLVLASRYIPGARIEGWPWRRLAVSELGNLYARSILGLGVRDLTGGFKAFKRKVLESFDLDRIYSDGYAFQIETTFRAIKKGFSVCEIPITFKDRIQGQSKISRKVVWEAVGIVWKLKFSIG